MGRTEITGLWEPVRECDRVETNSILILNNEISILRTIATKKY